MLKNLQGVKSQNLDVLNCLDSRNRYSRARVYKKAKSLNGTKINTMGVGSQERLFLQRATPNIYI